MAEAHDLIYGHENTIASTNQTIITLFPFSPITF